MFANPLNKTWRKDRHRKCLTLGTNVRSQAVDSRTDLATSRVVSEQFQFRGLTLLNSTKPKPDRRQVWPASSVPFAAATRHNFAIWSLKKSEGSRRRLHLYHCVRCKWSFRVDDRSGAVMPLDQNGNPIQGYEAAERLATFGVGPCPSFSRVIGGARATQVVKRSEAFRGSLVAMCFLARALKGALPKKAENLVHAMRRLSAKHNPKPHC
jgi:hypothetical protein